MPVTPRTKERIIGGVIGATGLTLLYVLFGGDRRKRPVFLPRGREREEHEKHRKREKHEKRRHRHEDNDRGEYGRKRRRHEDRDDD